MNQRKLRKRPNNIITDEPNAVEKILQTIIPRKHYKIVLVYL
jgi:hypothetical protein